MPAAHLLGATRALELLLRKLPDRLEHPVALDRRSAGGSSRRATAGCRGRRRATSSAASSVQPPAKTERRANELLLSGGEQVVAPLDRRPQRPLAGIGVAAALEEVEALESRSRIWAGESAFVRAAASSTASGSESRRAQSSAISSVGSSCARSQKSVDRLGLGERRNRVLDLALHAQELAARDEEGEVGAGARGARRARAPPRSPAPGCRGGAASPARRCARRAPSFAPSVWAIVSVTSAGSRSEASPTQKTPPCTRGRAWRRPRARGGSCPCRRGR